MKYVPRERLIASTNYGMAPIRWDVAYGKLAALAQGAALARKLLVRGLGIQVPGGARG
jgi:5-methyltetrahydropteroyltriglutamate--homocysteine methyltransferase